MNDLARLVLLPALMLLGLGACQAEQPRPPLEGARMGGPFTLTSHEGRRVSSDQFAGKYRIVYFGYTHCPDVCPADLASIGAALRQFEQKHPDRAAKVQPIFITSDPARDTPPVIAEFVRNFHPRLIGLTGTPQEIAQVARTHAIHFAAREPSPGNAAYLVDHNRVTALYGPEGQPIILLKSDEGPAAILADLEQWVR